MWNALFMAWTIGSEVSQCHVVCKCMHISRIIPSIIEDELDRSRLTENSVFPILKLRPGFAEKNRTCRELFNKDILSITCTMTRRGTSGRYGTHSSGRAHSCFGYKKPVTIFGFRIEIYVYVGWLNEQSRMAEFIERHEEEYSKMTRHSWNGSPLNTCTLCSSPIRNSPRRNSSTCFRCRSGTR